MNANRIYFWLYTVFTLPYLFAACVSSHQPQNQRLEDFQEMVFVTNLVNDEQKQKEYMDYHEHVWPEVEEGFKKAGYREISLYRFQDLLVMIVSVPKGADLEQMGRIAESYDKRCAEWNRIMADYQSGIEGARPGQTWVEARRFYSFRNE